jgi:hypothetical protein
MDVITGLGALSQALNIAKDLREIGRTYDEATFKLRMSELQSALADAKIGLSQSSERIVELERELDLARNGDFCPKCLSGRMQLIGTELHTKRHLHNFGVENWNYECSDENCGFQQARIHDPHGILATEARKR